MRSALDEIVLDGAQRMLAAALEAEVDAYIATLVNERDERGRRHVVRNGHAEPRTITTAAGRIEVEAPRVVWQFYSASEWDSPEYATGVALR